MLNLLLKTMFLEDNNISCKLSYIWVEIYVLGVTIYSGVYDTPQINKTEIILSHLYTNIGSFCTGPQAKFGPKPKTQSPIKSSRGNSIRDKSYYYCAHTIASILQKHNITYDKAYLRCGLERDTSRNNCHSTKKFAHSCLK